MEHRWSRRHFLAATTLATVGTAVGADSDDPPPPPKPKIHVGCQLSGWSQYYERDGKTLAANLDATLAAIHATGYEYAEGSLDLEHPENTLHFADQLRAHRLAPVSLYMTGTFHEAETYRRNVSRYLEAATIAKRAGFTILNCKCQALDRDKKPPELKTQVAALCLFGEGLNKLGMRLSVHHQKSELRNGGLEYHYNFRQSPSPVVGFCYDVDLLNRVGLPPVTVVRDYGRRIVSWYLRQSRDGIGCEELMDGDIDYRAVAAIASEKRLAPYFTVELALEPETKVTRTAIENHRRSREYVRTVFGG